VPHDPRRRPAPKVPRANKVASRWRIDPGSSFFAAPDAYFLALWDAGVTPYEERVLTAALLSWRWGDGEHSSLVSCAEIARRTRTSDRRAVRRAFLSLADKTVISFFCGGDGRKSELNITPLFRLVSAYSSGKRRGTETRRLGDKDSQVRGQGLAGDLQASVPLTCEVAGSGMTTQIVPEVPEEKRSASSSSVGVPPASAAPSQSSREQQEARRRDFLAQLAASDTKEAS